MKSDISPFIYLTILVMVAAVALPAFAKVTISDEGNIVITAQGKVLGDDDSNDDESDDDNSGSGNSNDDEQDEEDEEDEEDEQKETETENEDGTRTKTKIEDDGEVRTEVRLPDGTKVKTRTEDGRTRTDVYQGGTKVRFEREGDRFRIKVEDEDGQETEVGDDELISIDERADKNQIRVRTFATAEDQARNRAIIERLNTQALTDLPLSVNLETNELTVTTSTGEKTVAVLPDQAVQNMLAANVIDQIGGQELIDLVHQGGIETLDQVILLSEENGTPVYQVSGVKRHRLFAFIPVTTDVEVTVSAETGEVIDESQSFADNVIDIFSTSVL